jgi:glycosyltransferase involved in cell wall biosynthesis
MTDDMWQNILLHEQNGEKELAVVIPTYNNSRWCMRNIESVLMQAYDNYHVYIIDDCSTDDTYQKISAYLSTHTYAYKVTLIRNNERRGAMANWFTCISGLKDHVIVLNLDGDDWLAHSNVFSSVNNAYANRNVWMTYGQFKTWPEGHIGFCRRYNEQITRRQGYRDAEWLSSHLRTYYVWLFNKIKPEDFMYKGRFLPATCDRAIMYPLLEMCAGHYYCFEDVLYIYNTQNPIADMRVHLPEQQMMCRYIISLPKYKALDGIVVT